VRRSLRLAPALRMRIFRTPPSLALYLGAMLRSAAHGSTDGHRSGKLYLVGERISATPYLGSSLTLKWAFAKRVDFTSSKFRTRTFFDHSNFDGEVQFSRSVFEDRASFHEANFAETREFGPMLVKRQLDLNGATFQQRVQIEAAALALCARRIRFPSGAQLRVRWAQVVLDDADFSVSSTLTGVPPFAELDENRFAKA
jgi:uncharacterized protein YjbI with pentapeptide repeats